MMKTGNGILTGLIAAYAACDITHLGFASDAMDITSGRARALAAAVVGLISLVSVGWLWPGPPVAAGELGPSRPSCWG